MKCPMHNVELVKMAPDNFFTRDIMICPIEECYFTIYVQDRLTEFEF